MAKELKEKLSITKEMLDEVIKLSKGNEKISKVFEVIDAIGAELLKAKDLSSYVRKNAKNSFVSPTEMFVLAYDFLNTTQHIRKLNDTKKRINLFDLFDTEKK